MGVLEASPSRKAQVTAVVSGWRGTCQLKHGAQIRETDPCNSLPGPAPELHAVGGAVCPELLRMCRSHQPQPPGEFPPWRTEPHQCHLRCNSLGGTRAWPSSRDSRSPSSESSSSLIFLTPEQTPRSCAGLKDREENLGRLPRLRAYIFTQTGAQAVTSL